MIEILSLPKRPKGIPVNRTATSNLESGLPLNSLPGWEEIPLDCKLPMLKSPGNQVIFTKSKIGQVKHNDSQEFEVTPCASFPEYSPLQDKNLRSFFANEKNLRRLRENGEITPDNYVISSLKDFNKFRQELHKRGGMKEQKKREDEQRDRALIAYAEYISQCDYQNLANRRDYRQEAIQRKTQTDQQRQERNKKIWQTKLNKIALIKMRQDVKATTIEHQKLLQQLRMKRHWDRSHDIYRRKHNALVKHLSFKSDRFKRNMKKLREKSSRNTDERLINAWNKRIAERIANQEKIRNLLAKIEKEKKVSIEKHKTKSQEKWLAIQKAIKNRAMRNRKKFQFHIRKEQSVPPNEPGAHKSSFCAEFQSSFDRLHEADVCKALNAVLDLQDDIKLPFAADDPIYKAVEFIMQHILQKLNKDLSGNKVAYQSLYERIDKFFEDAKKFVIFRSTQIISAARKSMGDAMSHKSYEKDFNHGKAKSFSKRTSTGRVSFNGISSTIGISSYEIHPLIKVKEVGHRRPTPAGSLASFVLHSNTSLAQKTEIPNLCRNELVFIEHYFSKFKRDLIVGVGRRVFAAIQCHFENKIMDVRQELLEIDRKFLVKRTTKSILSYAVNSLDFDSNLKLCISALSSDVIWSLQKVLLKTIRDPRRIVKPHCNCNCMKQGKDFC